MNKRNNHVEKKFLDLKTFILGISTQFSLQKDNKTIGKSNKRGECMSIEAKQFKCVCRPKPNAIT